MNLRETAGHIIAGHEGEVLRAYDDATGKVVNPGDVVKGWITIGKGRNLVGRGITKAESDYLFQNDCAVVEEGLDRLFPWWRQMSDGRQVALYDFAYNQGPDKLAAKWPKTMAALQAGQYQAVANSLRGTPWYRQVGKVRGEAVCRGIETGAVHT